MAANTGNSRSIANIIRKAVSQKRVRFQDGRFDLDLTYITKEVIAMGLPASGVHSLYRNKVQDVSDMLNQYHPGKYLFFNLSQKSYDYNAFNNQVLDLGWPDHHAPPLEILFQICRAMASWCSADPENVCIVHCKAGKGRTGTVIACFLLYAGVFTDPMDALTYFARRRSRATDGRGGVTIPSQLRYVYYFNRVLNGFIPAPRRYFLSSMVARGVPTRAALVAPEGDQAGSGDGGKAGIWSRFKSTVSGRGRSGDASAGQGAGGAGAEGKSAHLHESMDSDDGESDEDDDSHSTASNGSSAATLTPLPPSVAAIAAHNDTGSGYSSFTAPPAASTPASISISLAPYSSTDGGAAGEGAADDDDPPPPPPEDTGTPPPYPDGPASPTGAVPPPPAYKHPDLIPRPSHSTGAGAAGGVIVTPSPSHHHNHHSHHHHSHSHGAAGTAVAPAHAPSSTASPEHAGPPPPIDVYFEVCDAAGTVISSNKAMPVLLQADRPRREIPIQTMLPASGDVLIRACVAPKGGWAKLAALRNGSGPELFRVAINTAFSPPGSTLTFRKADLDGACKSKAFSEDFEFEFTFVAPESHARVTPRPNSSFGVSSAAPAASTAPSTSAAAAAGAGGAGMSTPPPVPQKQLSLSTAAPTPARQLSRPASAGATPRGSLGSAGAPMPPLPPKPAGSPLQAPAASPSVAVSPTAGTAGGAGEASCLNASSPTSVGGAGSCGAGGATSPVSQSGGPAALPPRPVRPARPGTAAAAPASGPGAALPASASTSSLPPAPAHIHSPAAAAAAAAAAPAAHTAAAAALAVGESGSSYMFEAALLARKMSLPVLNVRLLPINCRAGPDDNPEPEPVKKQ